MLNRIKHQLRKALTTFPALTRLYRAALRGRAVIFMLHRFADPGARLAGHDPRSLDQALAALRARGHEMLDLDELLGRLIQGEALPPGAIAFTIDDGYYDHAHIGEPVFARYDCPVTTFLTTGFIDGSTWFWWDQLEFILTRSQRASVQLETGPGLHSYDLRDPGHQRNAREELVGRCKELPDAAKRDLIARLAEAADVEIPTTAPDRYRPMTWNEARACERGVMRFGPHTVTHPILARTAQQQAEFEIRESWSRLRMELADPVPVFCYPNGQEGDFGEREMRILRDCGLLGAVTGSPGYASQASTASDPTARFLIPRFAWSDDIAEVLQYASGLERVRELAWSGSGR